MSGQGGPLQFDPLALAQEAMQFHRRLTQGLRVLGQVGEVDYGATGREEVWRDGKAVLYRFVGERAPTGPALLIVYALVNRPYMVDLQADRSLVRGLLALGLDVYVLDWGYPDRSDRYLALDDYINRFIDGAVDHLAAATSQPVNLLGVCQGGTFSLCYAALHPDKVRNLVTMVTPVDLQTPGKMLSDVCHVSSVVLFGDTWTRSATDL